MSSPARISIFFSREIPRKSPFWEPITINIRRPISFASAVHARFPLQSSATSSIRDQSAGRQAEQLRQQNTRNENFLAWLVSSDTFAWKTVWGCRFSAFRFAIVRSIFESWLPLGQSLGSETLYLISTALQAERERIFSNIKYIAGFEPSPRVCKELTRVFNIVPFGDKLDTLVAAKLWVLICVQE